MNTRKLIAVVTIICAAALPSFAANWLEGANGNFSDPACWVGETVPTTGDLDYYNTSGNFLYVTNDVTDTGTWNGAVKVQFGLWNFSGSFTPTIKHLLLCHATTGPASVVNYCDWNILNFFAIGHNDNAAGSTATFTNRSGRIYIGGGQTWHLAIARYKGSPTGTLVFEGGELTTATNNINSTIGHGANGAPGAVGTLLMKGGKISLNHNASTYLGGYGTGYLTIEGGTFSVNPNGAGIIFGAAGSSTGHLLLKGGTLAAALLDKGSGTGASTFTINGGKWRVDGTSSKGYAIANSAKLTFAVGADGGTIEVANGAHAVIPTDVNEYPGSTGGGLTLAGFGTISFAGAIKYTGKTTIQLGAAVSVTNSCILTGGVAVAVPETPPDDGMYTVLTTTGEDTLDTLYASATFPTSDPKARFRLSADKKSIICLYGDVPQTWIGGASGDLGDATKWSTGLVPTSGNAVITSGSAATLTNNAAFTPDAITFAAESALVTINGEDAIANLLAITNNSSQHHVFNCPVAFKADEVADIPSANANYVSFAGGMTAYALRKTGANAYVHGSISLTKENVDWDRNGDNDLIYLVSGTTLTIPQLKNTGAANFSVGEDATLVVLGDAVISGSEQRYIVYAINGTVDVRGIVDASGVSALAYLMEVASNDQGVIRTKGVVRSSSAHFVMNGNSTGSSGNIGAWVIGEAGMSYSGNGSYDFYEQKRGPTTLARIYASADFAINSSMQLSARRLLIRTSDMNDSSHGYVITLNGTIKNNSTSNKGSVLASGRGTLVFNAEQSFSGGLEANNSVIVAVNAGFRPGAGAVDMTENSTLKVAQSGTVTLGGNLTLGATATLAFNFTDRMTAPMLVIPAASTIPETVNVKVSASDGVKPSSSQTHTLTSTFNFTGKTVNLVDKPNWVKSVEVVDGNLVLTAKPKGLQVIVR